MNASLPPESPLIELRFTVSLPCRTNERTRHTEGGHTYTPDEAQQKLDKTIAAVRELAREHGTFYCGFVIETVFYFGHRGGDADGREKSLRDCLHFGELIIDDAQICGGSSYAFFDPKNPRVEVLLRETRDPALLDRWSAGIAKAARKGENFLDAAQSEWAAGVRKKREEEALRKVIRAANRRKLKNAGRRKRPGGKMAA